MQNRFSRSDKNIGKRKRIPKRKKKDKGLIYTNQFKMVRDLSVFITIRRNVWLM